MTLRAPALRGNIFLILGIVGGILGGIYFPQFMSSISWIGTIFFNMLKVLVLPLIVSAIITAIAGIANSKKLSTLGSFTVSYAVLSSVIAVSIGLILFNTLSPGLGVKTSFADSLGENIKNAQPLTFHHYITGLVPSNILDAAVRFDVMAVVIFTVAFALACVACKEESRHVVQFFTHLRNVMLKMISWVIALSPLGIFSLLGTAVANSVMKNQLASDLQALGMFVVVFFAGLILQFAWQMFAIRFFVRHSVLRYLKITSPALITAFGTSSSLATLPVSMSCAEKTGVREDINRFTLPMAATINLGATVMYEACAALFFAQVLGMHLSTQQQIIIFVTSIVAGMGVTGIPEAGLITMVTVLKAVNIPVHMISILLPLDRILDRFRTLVNTWGDICCASVVNELVQRKEKNDMLATEIMVPLEEEKT